ncbi:uncharacterized protein PG998_010056 [Apiospora kogelbergensis]|uniref:uncharacterized protein n=1 Tax=Apiospora kogelbergensis TaxID=1337665 RepID=UPI00313075E9
MPRPSTPPRAPDPSKAAVTPPTPAVARRIEENRLKAKAIREANDAAQRQAGVPPPLSRTRSGAVDDEVQQGPYNRKRAHDVISSTRNLPSTSRDGRINGAADAAAAKPDKDGEVIRPAKKFQKFVDYDFDKITDTKGGFLSTEDDPFNKAMSGSATAGGSNRKPGAPEPPEERPKGMTVAEWERLQTIKRLRRQKAGPFEPGLGMLEPSERKKCRECGSLEIDFVWEEVLKCAVCGRCKEAKPEKYSLLTKTECKDDYLLTDPELRDEELLPHLSRPNPHKSHWHDMMLFLRYQVEEYAFSDKRWGSAEALDEEFERRETEKKKRKEAKFKSKLLDLKKRTRTDAYRREHGKLGGTSSGGGGGKARFDDVLGGGKHVHDWGRTIENEAGMTVKTCTTCGMEVEELEF